jgi:hypothetical protein
MTDGTKQEVVDLSIRLLDDVYMAWFVAERECEHALRKWFQSSRRSPDAYFAYCAALDREEAAAVDLQRLMELTKPLQGAIAERAPEALK